MRKEGIFVAIILAIAGGLLVFFSPSGIPMFIVSIMCVILVFGYVFGMFPLLRYTHSFFIARNRLKRVMEIQTENPWIAVKNIDSLFHDEYLDTLFDEYRGLVAKQKNDNTVMYEIEDIINEEVIGLKSWKSVMLQMPGTLTGLGLLGTFIGLLIGIGSIGFTSVTAAIQSVQTLLEGVKTAFYTSVAGVILSILFNLFYKIIWSRLEKEFYLFCKSFHENIIPDRKMQIENQQLLIEKKILERLDKIVESKEA